MQTVKLSDVCTIVSGSTPKTDEPAFWNGTLKWVTPAELRDDTIFVTDTERHITEAAARSAHLTPFPAGTVLLSSRAPIGKTAIAGAEMYCNQGFKNLICSDRINNRYLYYFLTSRTRYLNDLGRGATFKEISKTIVENIEIPLPPLAEQQRIVRELQQVGALLANRRQVDEQLAELPKARFVEMFGDPVVNPMGWEKQRISNISIRANNGMARRGNDPDGNIVLRLVELQDGYIDYQAPNRILLTPGEKEKYLLTEGDFLFARVNGNPENVGRCAVFHDIGEPVYHNDHIIRYHFNQHIDGTYLSALLNSYYGKWQMHSKIKTSAGQYTISQDGIGEVEVPLPPLDLQRRFAAFARACAAQRAACARQIAVLETLRGKLLQDAFGAAG